ncbi:MAG: hypothetical protein NVS3B28_12690 [Candidatus Velthaea sp.]
MNAPFRVPTRTRTLLMSNPPPQKVVGSGSVFLAPRAGAKGRPGAGQNDGLHEHSHGASGGYRDLIIDRIAR